MELPIMYVYKHAGEKIHSNMDKIWGINVSNLYVLFKYLIYEVKQLEFIGYLTCYIDYWNFEKINRLIGYSVKVHSTMFYTYNRIACIYFAVSSRAIIL